MSSKVVFIGLAVVFLCFSFGSVAQPAIDHGGKCCLCHDTHGGGMSGLLKEEYQGNQGCINCHSSATSSTTYELTGDCGGGGMHSIAVPVVVYTGENPPDNYLAGGNFWWVKGTANGIPGDAGNWEGGLDDTKGHNIFPGEPDDDLADAPGRVFSCSSPQPNSSCHFNLNETVQDGLGLPGLWGRQGCTKCHMLSDSEGPIASGFHHADDSNIVVGGETNDPDGFYRFLKGHMSAEGAGVSGIEDDDWEATTSATDHNEYLGYSANKDQPGYFIAFQFRHCMTAYCGGCHGNFHISSDSAGGGDWIRHPAAAVLPDETPDSEFEAYTQYNPKAPVSRPDLNVFTLPDTNPDKRYSNEVSPGVDLANCLSCHRAHGSPYPHMLRWDPTAAEACAICHTTKVSETPGQYHVADVADCNVCHGAHGVGGNWTGPPDDPYDPYDPHDNKSLILEKITTPKSGDKAVTFPSGGDSDFVSGPPDYDGVCEVCHTTTAYYRNDGTGAEHFPGSNCCTTCHSHENEFAAAAPDNPSHVTHTDGTAKGPDAMACKDCHVSCTIDGMVGGGVCNPCHSPGGVIDGVNDATIGARHNWEDGVYEASGTTLKSGKEKWCVTCHDDDPTTTDNESALINEVSAPGIAGVDVSPGAWDITPVSGPAALLDGHTDTGNTWFLEAEFDLGEEYLITDIRMYVKDARPDGITWQVFAGDGSTWTRVLGAENPAYSWKTGHLDPGEGWYQAKMDVCVTARYLKIAKSVGPCLPGTVFEVEFGRDNLQYGYFHTGHGIKCSNCHDFSKTHIDGDARTYAASANNYQEGYRLKLANVVPRVGVGVASSDFALCLDCHGDEAFVNGDNMTATNFKDDGEAVNDHFRHLMDTSGLYFDSDFNGVADSDMTCTACHNVHGSPTPGMVRHGELNNKVPGLNLRYINNMTGDPDGNIENACIEDPENPGSCIEPYSSGAETYFWGTGQGSVLKNGICNMCHNDYIRYMRTPEDLTMPDPAGFGVITLCPVDLRVIDPDGLIIDKVVNEIGGASYFEGDIDGDGSIDDRIIIPHRKIGEYTVLILPESNPDPDDKDTYSLKAMVSNETMLLAEDVPIGAPDSEDQYTVISTESGISTESAGLSITALDDGGGYGSDGDGGSVSGGGGCFIDTADAWRLRR